MPPLLGLVCTRWTRFHCSLGWLDAGSPAGVHNPPNSICHLYIQDHRRQPRPLSLFFPFFFLDKVRPKNTSTQCTEHTLSETAELPPLPSSPLPLLPPLPPRADDSSAMVLLVSINGWIVTQKDVTQKGWTQRLAVRQPILTPHGRSWIGRLWVVVGGRHDFLAASLPLANAVYQRSYSCLVLLPRCQQAKLAKLLGHA